MEIYSPNTINPDARQPFDRPNPSSLPQPQLDSKPTNPNDPTSLPFFDSGYGNDFGNMSAEDMQSWWQNWRETFNSENRPLTDTGWSNFWNWMSIWQAMQSQQFNADQSDLAYARSLPTTQLANLMAAGVSRTAALSMLSGANAQMASGAAAAPSWNNAVNADVNSATSILDTSLNAVSTIAGLGSQVYQSYLGMQEMRGDALVAPVADQIYSIHRNYPDAPMPDTAALQSPQRLKDWMRSQPKNSPWHDVYSSEAWDKMASSLYGQKAFRREFMENLACRSFHEMESDADLIRQNRYWAAQNQSMTFKIAENRFNKESLEYQQYEQVASLMTDVEVEQLNTKLRAATWENNPYMIKQRYNALVGSAEYESYVNQIKAAQQQSVWSSYKKDPAYKSAVNLAARLEYLGIPDNGLGEALRVGNALNSGIVNEHFISSAIQAGSNAALSTIDAASSQVPQAIQKAAQAVVGEKSPSEPDGPITNATRNLTNPFHPIDNAKAQKASWDNAQAYRKSLYEKNPNQVWIERGTGKHFKVVKNWNGVYKKVYQ